MDTHTHRHTHTHAPQTDKMTGCIPSGAGQVWRENQVQSPVSQPEGRLKPAQCHPTHGEDVWIPPLTALQIKCFKVRPLVFVSPQGKLINYSGHLLKLQNVYRADGLQAIVWGDTAASAFQTHYISLFLSLLSLFPLVCFLPLSLSNTHTHIRESERK